MEQKNTVPKDGDILEMNRYEPIANEMIAVMAEHEVQFWEVSAILELLKAKCRYQNQGKSLV